MPKMSAFPNRCNAGISDVRKFPISISPMEAGYRLSSE